MAAVPIHAHQVTKAWLKEAVEAEGAAEDVEVASLEQVTVKEGFLSTAFGAKISFTDKKSGKRESMKLFMKIMPSVDEKLEFSDLGDPERAKDVIVDEDLDLVEEGFYRTALAEIVEYEENLLGKEGGVAAVRVMVPRFVAGGSNRLPKKDRGFYLVLEDVSDRFAMPDFNAGLSAEKVRAALGPLARFHAVTMSFLQKKESAADYDFLCTFFHEWKENVGFQGWIQEMSEEFLKENEGTDIATEHRELFTDLGRKLGHGLGEVFSEDATKFPALIHGDYWASNILFGKRDDKVSVVDWQFFMKGSVFMDIALIALVSMSPPEDTGTHLESFCDTYYGAFADHSRKLGNMNDMPWTRKRFGELVDTLSLYFAFTWTMIAYDLREKCPDLGPRAAWLARRCARHCPQFFHY